MIGSLNGVCMFASNQDVSLLNTVTDDAKVVWKVFNEKWAFITFVLNATKVNKKSEVMPIAHQAQCAKKVMCHSPGLVDCAVELVIFVLNLPDGQVLFFVEIQITEGF